MNRYVLQVLSDGKYLFDQQTGKLWKLVIVATSIPGAERYEWVLQTRPLVP